MRPLQARSKDLPPLQARIDATTPSTLQRPPSTPNTTRCDHSKHAPKTFLHSTHDSMRPIHTDELPDRTSGTCNLRHRRRRYLGRWKRKVPGEMVTPLPTDTVGTKNRYPNQVSRKKLSFRVEIDNVIQDLPPLQARIDATTHAPKTSIHSTHGVFTRPLPPARAYLPPLQARCSQDRLHNLHSLQVRSKDRLHPPITSIHSNFAGTSNSLHPHTFFFSSSHREKRT